MNGSDATSRLPEPDAHERARSDRLVGRLRAAIEASDDWLPFDLYMNEVLYAPGVGYYAAGRAKIGDFAAGGDFVTAPEISPLFARALATQVAEIFDSTPKRILEFGAGTGVLAPELIDALGEARIALEDYAIVDVSADFSERQRHTLAGRNATWLSAPPESFEGVILANEVLDVMPVKLFAKRDGRVVERGVIWRDGRLAFSDRTAGDDLVAAVERIEHETGVVFADGYASEIGWVAQAWMRSLAGWLAHGVALIIDYGFPRREYFHPQRIMGTLMCHFRHRAHADLLWHPGLSDVTAHVDFTAAADAAHQAGLDVLGYTTQAHFLLNCGLLDRLKADHGHRQANEAHRLLSEAEMGELFKVLAVGRNVSNPLRGFARGDRRHAL